MTAFAATASADRFGVMPLKRRMAIMAGVVLLHGAIVLLLYAGFLAGGVLTKRPQREGRSLTLFDLAHSAAAQGQTAPGERQAGGSRGTPQEGASREDIRQVRQAGTEAVDGQALGDALAAELADDPLASAGQASYQERLRRHIARYRRSPDDVDARTRFGTAVIRVNIARDGWIIDARIMETRGANLDKAALDALWRAEPLPTVPADLPAPLGVDVAIEFVRR